MDMLESMQMAVKTLAANKLRSALTMLGIVIGNASVIAMIGIGQGAQRLASEQFESLGPNVLFVIPGTRNARRTTLNLPKTLVLSDAEAIATQVPTVSGVAPQVSARAIVRYGNQNRDSLVIGVTPDYLTVRSFDVAKGRYISDLDVKRTDRVTALGPDLAEKLFQCNFEQDKCKIALGQQVRIRNISFLVIGIMEPKGAFLGTNQDESAFIPLSTMSNRIVGRTSPFGTELSFISAAAVNEASVQAAQFQITNLLRQRHKIVCDKDGCKDDFSVESQKDALEIVTTITGGLTIMLGAIAGISLLVGGIGIMNIMLVSVTERTGEIGLRKALGATQQDVLIQFIIEAIILASVGGVFGTLIGVSGITLVSVFTPLKAGISPIAICVAVGVSGGIGLFFGVVPARRAAQLDPIVALRSV